MQINAFQKHCLGLLFAACLALGSACGTAAAEPRTALVIGNAAYPFGPLANPVNDATDIATALRDAGFEVSLKTNAGSDEMKQAIRKFGDALKTRGGIGLFYFAGHGVQLKGENFIVPIIKHVGGEDDLKRDAVSATEAVDVMAAAHNALNIVVLDACRNNPFTGGTKGLSRIDSNARLFVSYSTSPGSVALDGKSRNSPYTKYLSRAIETPALSLEDTFKRTLKGVYQETKGQQTPWISSTFFGDFVFHPKTGTTLAARPSTGSAGPAVVQSSGSLSQFFNKRGGTPAVTGVYRADGRNPNGRRYSGMVAITPDGNRVRVRWWIGRQVFNGMGEYAGRMLVVNWGAKHPVVYSFAGDRLNGEWADGTATEDLTLFSRATDEAVARPQGRYGVRGRNPNGSRYSGIAEIRDLGDHIVIEWQVGSKHYRGTGTLTGNVLTVDWGATTPVVYALTSDGRLRGLWNNGRGEEVLTQLR
jgi:Caspase domain